MIYLCYVYSACLVLGCLFLVSAVSIAIKSSLALVDHILPGTVSLPAEEIMDLFVPIECDTLYVIVAFWKFHNFLS